jgi:subtilisin-like proprotein convertase family protein
MAIVAAFCAPVLSFSNLSRADGPAMGEFNGPFSPSAFTRIASSNASDTTVPGFPTLKFTSTRLAGVEGNSAIFTGMYIDPSTAATRSGLYTRLPGGSVSSLVDSFSPTTGGETIRSIVATGEWIDGQVTFAANTTAGEKLYRRETDGKLTTLISAGDIIPGGNGESISGFIKVGGDSHGYAFSAHLSNGTDAFLQSTASSAASAVTLADERSRFLIPEPVSLISYPEVAYLNGLGAFIPTALEVDRPGIIEPVGVMLAQPGNPIRFPIYKFGAIVGAPHPDYRFLEFEKLRLLEHGGDRWVGFAGGYIDEENPTSGINYMGVFTVDEAGGWKNWVNSDMPLPGLRAHVQEFNGFGLSNYSFAAGAVDVNGGRYIFTEVGGVLNYVLSTYDLLDGKALSAIRWNQDNIDGYTLFFTADFADGTTGVYSVLLPEPTTAASLIGLTGLLSRRRRRASSCFRAVNGVESLESRRMLVGETVLAPVNASKSSDNENEVDIGVNPANPLQVYTVSNSSANGLRSSVSSDGGASFTNTLLTSISGDVTFCDARVVFDYFGNLWLAYLNTAGNLSLARSTNGGSTFSLVQKWTGSWDNPSIAVGANNFVAIQATGPSGQTAVGIQATGLGTAGTPVGPQVAPSSTGGFGDIVVANNGAILLTAHASTGGQGPTTLPIYRDPDGLGTGAGFTLQTSISTNVGGFDFIPAQNSRSIDSEPNFAVVPAGAPNANRIYMTYTDELTNESNNTNVMLRWSDNGGVTWSSPIQLNDDLGTRSQFLQSMAIDPTTGAIGVAWYDSRNDGGVSGSGSTNSVANDDAQIYGVFSMDGGTTWQPNIQLSSNVTNANTANSPTDYGDWTGAKFYAGKFYFGYTDNSAALSPANPSRPKLDIAVARVLVNSTPVTGIAGGVFDDSNVNGAFDGEGGVAGVTVYIDANNNSVLDAGELSAVTDAGGSFSFTAGVAAGTYTLRVVTPANRRLTTAGSLSVTVTADQITTNQRFGITSLAAVNGVVYDDVNANGVRDAGEPPLVGARIFIDANNNGLFDNGFVSLPSTNVPVSIPQSGTPTVTSTLVAPVTTGTVSNLTVTLNITHTFTGDLVLTLISPSGTRVTLASRNGSSGDNFTNTVFSDAAATIISSGTAPFNGTFRPIGSLATLNGQSGAGTWTLEVADQADQDGGTINSWSISFGSTETNVLTDASGNYSFPALPGASYNFRQVLTAGYGFTNPSSGLQALTAAAGTVYSRDFGSRDLNRPLQTVGGFVVDAAVQTVTVSFNEDVVIDSSRITLTNLTTASVVPTANIAVSFDSATDTASITFPGYANGVLPNGNYRLEVLASVTDTGGAPIANPSSVDFFTLAGDVNRDRAVNFDDLLVIAQNYGQSGKVYTQGNVNYSADGAVGFDDLLILAQNYGVTMAASVIAPFSSTPIRSKARAVRDVLA